MIPLPVFFLAKNLSPPVLIPFERIICVVLFLTTAIIGFSSCCYILIYAIFHSKRRNSFYIICIYKCVANSLVLIIFIFWNGPLIILGISTTTEGLQGIVNLIGSTVYVRIYEMLLWISLILAINRFIAIVFWNCYERLFKAEIIYVILFLFGGYLMYKAILRRSLKVVYDGYLMTWTVQEDIRPPIVRGVFVLIGSAFCLNLLTLLYLVCSTILHKTEGISSSQRVKENSLLFIQTFLQDLLFIIDVVFMYILSQFWKNPIFMFICRNYTSLLVHSLDGPIMIIFQPHLLHPLKKILGLVEKEEDSSIGASQRPVSGRRRQIFP